MVKNGNKLKKSTEQALELAFLEDEIEAMTKEYLLLNKNIANRIIPTTAFPYRWRTMHRKMEILNNDLEEKNYRIEEDGVHLKNNYDIEKECREYLRYILIRILAPAAKLENAYDVVFGRFINQTAYTDKQRMELDALTQRFEGIFASKEFPHNPDFLHFPSELKLYLAYLQNYYHPLRDILSEIWHRTLKAGDDLTEIFRKYEKTETLSAFRSLPFPAIFQIEGQEIILNEFPEEIFLFLLSGLMTKEFSNKHYAWEFYINTYFYGYNKGVFSPKEV